MFFCVYLALTAATASAGELESPATTSDDTKNVQAAKRVRAGGGGPAAAEILLLSVQNARQQQQTDEVAGYAKEPPADINTNPLAWWKSNGARYQKLAALALKYLGIPATSVPSERIFSKAGEIVNRRRASLKPWTVDMLVFLSKNLKVLHEN